MTKICKHWSSSRLNTKRQSKGELIMKEREMGKETVSQHTSVCLMPSRNTLAKNWFSLGGWDLKALLRPSNHIAFETTKGIQKSKY